MKSKRAAGEAGRCPPTAPLLPLFIPNTFQLLSLPANTVAVKGAVPALPTPHTQKAFKSFTLAAEKKIMGESGEGGCMKVFSRVG